MPSALRQFWTVFLLLYYPRHVYIPSNMHTKGITVGDRSKCVCLLIEWHLPVELSSSQNLIWKVEGSMKRFLEMHGWR